MAPLILTTTMKFFGRGSVTVTIIGLIFSFIVVPSFEKSHTAAPTFFCENGRVVNLTGHNGGMNVCSDNSDEYDDPLLLRSVHNDAVAGTKGSSNELIITGTFLRKQSEFRMRIPSQTCGYGKTLAPFDSHGQYLYLMCEGINDSIFRVSRRNHTDLKKISFHGKNITSFTFDRITSNVYLLANNKCIEMCDSEFDFCSTLQGQLRKNPIGLTFSSEEGLLFWIEKSINNTTSRWFIVKSRRDGSSPKPLYVSATALEFITVDHGSRRLYWSEKTNDYGSKTVFSSAFNGSGIELFSTDVESADTFAVDRGNIYWADMLKTETRRCTIGDDGNCKPSSNQVVDECQTILKKVIVHFEKANTTKEKLLQRHACVEKPCSHLCTYFSTTNHSCFCPNLYNGTPSNPRNGFCEGVTVVSIRGNNSLYILVNSSGSGSSQDKWKPREITFKKINSSISAVTYDSIQGRVIFAVRGNQSIYSWTLGRSEPSQLISQGRSGTIKALEFDDWGNSIYWISSSDGTLKGHSFVTNQTTTILPKNSSSEPFALTLSPITGSIYTLSKTKNSINLERIPVENNKGKPIGSRKLLHRFRYTNISYLSLHYMRNENILILSNRLENKTEYADLKKFNGSGEINFLQLVKKDKSTGILHPVSTLDESVLSTKLDLQSQCYSTEEAIRRRTGKNNWKYAGVVAAVEPINYSQNRTISESYLGLYSAPLLYPIYRPSLNLFKTTTPRPTDWNEIYVVESLSKKTADKIADAMKQKIENEKNMNKKNKRNYGPKSTDPKFKTTTILKLVTQKTSAIGFDHNLPLRRTSAPPTSRPSRATKKINTKKKGGNGKNKKP